MIQERLFDIPLHPRSIFGDLEVCIRGDDSITSEDASATEISLSREMLILIGRWLGNEKRIKTLTDNVGSSGTFNEQLLEQLARDGNFYPPPHTHYTLHTHVYVYVYVYEMYVCMYVSCNSLLEHAFYFLLFGRCVVS